MVLVMIVVVSLWASCEGPFVFRSRSSVFSRFAWRSYRIDGIRRQARASVHWVFAPHEWRQLALVV